MYKLLGVKVTLDMGAPKILPLTYFNPNGGVFQNHVKWPSRSVDPVNGMDPLTSGIAKNVGLSVGLIKADGSGLNTGAPDTNPSDNIKYKDLGGRADLVVCFKKNEASHAHHNVRYRPTVKNIGDAPSDWVNLRFHIENKGVKNYSIPPLDPEEVYSDVSRKVYWVIGGVHRDYTLHVDSEQESFNEKWMNNIIRGKIYVANPGVSTNTTAVQCSDEPHMDDRNWSPVCCPWLGVKEKPELLLGKYWLSHAFRTGMRILRERIRRF